MKNLELLILVDNDGDNYLLDSVIKTFNEPNLLVLPLGKNYKPIEGKNTEYLTLNPNEVKYILIPFTDTGELPDLDNIPEAIRLNEIFSGYFLGFKFVENCTLTDRAEAIKSLLSDIKEAYSIKD